VEKDREKKRILLGGGKTNLLARGTQEDSKPWENKKIKSGRGKKNPTDEGRTSAGLTTAHGVRRRGSVYEYTSNVTHFIDTRAGHTTAYRGRGTEVLLEGARGYSGCGDITGGEKDGDPPSELQGTRCHETGRVDRKKPSDKDLIKCAP